MIEGFGYGAVQMMTDLDLGGPKTLVSSFFKLTVAINLYDGASSSGSAGHRTHMILLTCLFYSNSALKRHTCYQSRSKKYRKGVKYIKWGGDDFFVKELDSGTLATGGSPMWAADLRDILKGSGSESGVCERSRS